MTGPKVIQTKCQNGNKVPEWSREQDWVLRYNSELRSELGQWYSCYVHTINHHTTFSLFQHAEQSQSSRRLATPSTTTNTNLGDEKSVTVVLSRHKI